MTVSLQQPWLKVHKIVDLIILVVVAQSLFRRFFFDSTLIPTSLGTATVTLVFAAVVVEFWSLQTRSKFWVTPALIPIIVLAGTCASVWLIDPSMYSWVLAAMFLVFMRLPAQLATLAGGLAIGVSVWALAWHWELDIAVQMRAALSGGFIVVVLNLFFQVNKKILEELNQTRDFLNNALQNMSQGISVVGKDGRYKMSNDQVCAILDLPSSLMASKPLLSDVVKFQSDRGDFGPNFSRVEGAGRNYVAGLGLTDEGPIPTRYLRQNNSGRFIEVKTQTMPSGDMVRTYTDVTQYEEVNRQLKVVLDEYQELSEKWAQLGRDQMIVALTELSLIRDNETGLHTQRTQLYVKTLAQHLLGAGHYADELTDQNIEFLVKATPMHDLGKVGIPDHILLKPGRHTDEETKVMRTHAAMGESILMVMAGTEPRSDSLFVVAAKLAGEHHENWDGTGYPLGLSGQAISLGARLMALADVYDALTTPRVYKRAWTHQEAVDYILSLRGTKFDPIVVDAFEREEANFRAIALDLAED